MEKKVREGIPAKGLDGISDSGSLKRQQTRKKKKEVRQKDEMKRGGKSKG